jgi:hypothetical protein
MSLGVDADAEVESVDADAEVERVDASVINGSFPGGAFGKVITMTFDYPDRSIGARPKVVALKYFTKHEDVDSEVTNIAKIMAAVRAKAEADGSDLVERVERYTCLPFADTPELTPGELVSSITVFYKALNEAISKAAPTNLRRHDNLTNFKENVIIDRPIRMTTFNMNTDLDNADNMRLLFTDLRVKPKTVLGDVIYALYTTMDILLCTGWVHDDMKPGNVIMGGSIGAYEGVKVIDFGVATRSTEEKVSGTLAFYLFDPRYAKALLVKYEKEGLKAEDIEYDTSFKDVQRQRYFTVFSTFWCLVKEGHLALVDRRGPPLFLEYISGDPLLELFVRMVFDAMEALVIHTSQGKTMDSMQFMYDRVLKTAGVVSVNVDEEEMRPEAPKVDGKKQFPGYKFITDLVKRFFPAKASEAYRRTVTKFVGSGEYSEFDLDEFERWFGKQDRRGGGGVGDDPNGFLDGWGVFLGAVQAGAVRGRQVELSELKEDRNFMAFYNFATQHYSDPPVYNESNARSESMIPKPAMSTILPARPARPARPTIYTRPSVPATRINAVKNVNDAMDWFTPRPSKSGGGCHGRSAIGVCLVILASAIATLAA